MIEMDASRIVVETNAAIERLVAPALARRAEAGVVTFRFDDGRYQVSAHTRQDGTAFASSAEAEQVRDRILAIGGALRDDPTVHAQVLREHAPSLWVVTISMPPDLFREMVGRLDVLDVYDRILAEEQQRFDEARVALGTALLVFEDILPNRASIASIEVRDGEADARVTVRFTAPLSDPRELTSDMGITGGLRLDQWKDAFAARVAVALNIPRDGIRTQTVQGGIASVAIHGQENVASFVSQIESESARYREILAVYATLGSDFSRLDGQEQAQRVDRVLPLVAACSSDRQRRMTLVEITRALGTMTDGNLQERRVHLVIREIERLGEDEQRAAALFEICTCALQFDGLSFGGRLVAIERLARDVGQLPRVLREPCVMALRALDSLFSQPHQKWLLREWCNDAERRPEPQSPGNAPGQRL